MSFWYWGEESLMVEPKTMSCNFTHDNFRDLWTESLYRYRPKNSWQYPAWQLVSDSGDRITRDVTHVSLSEEAEGHLLLWVPYPVLGSISGSVHMGRMQSLAYSVLCVLASAAGAQSCTEKQLNKAQVGNQSSVFSPYSVFSTQFSVLIT